LADNQAEVEDEEDAPAPKATKAKADKSKKPAAKAEAAPVDDGKYMGFRVWNSLTQSDPNSTDPECIKVKDWRHRLQRAFLGKAPPTADVSDPPTQHQEIKLMIRKCQLTIPCSRPLRNTRTSPSRL
jgi:hypothetical protein